MFRLQINTSINIINKENLFNICLVSCPFWCIYILFHLELTKFRHLCVLVTIHEQEYIFDIKRKIRLTSNILTVFRDSIVDLIWLVRALDWYALQKGYF